MSKLCEDSWIWPATTDTVPKFVKLYVCKLTACLNQGRCSFFSRWLNASKPLKDLLTSPPILAYPNFTAKFVLHTDASGEDLRAVLEQEQDGKLHPVACASRSLTKSEKNYGVTELEALGVVWAVKHFQSYLISHKCTIVTDHAPLKSMLVVKHPSGKLACWSQTLAEIDAEIHYRLGRKHSNADALSRAPVDLHKGVVAI